MKNGIVGFVDITGELVLRGHQRLVLMLTATESESNPKTNLYFLKRNDSTSFIMKTGIFIGFKGTGVLGTGVLGGAGFEEVLEDLFRSSSCLRF
jgi:hypothetical protein